MRFERFGKCIGHVWRDVLFLYLLQPRQGFCGEDRRAEWRTMELCCQLGHLLHPSYHQAATKLVAMGLFALTNGFLATQAMVLIPTMVPASRWRRVVILFTRGGEYPSRDQHEQGHVEASKANQGASLSRVREAK